MALATLCSDLAKDDTTDLQLTAFIVNHRLRKDSEVEAHKVARALKQLLSMAKSLLQRFCVQGLR